jgi:hypothetical protein
LSLPSSHLRFLARSTTLKAPLLGRFFVIKKNYSSLVFTTSPLTRRQSVSSTVISLRCVLLAFGKGQFLRASGTFDSVSVYILTGCIY